MLLVLLVIFIALLVVTCVIPPIYDEDLCEAVIMICLVAILAAGIITGVAIVQVSEASVIDEKIAMYEEENQRIEASITAVVENYQQYETDIFKDVSESHSESSMILVTMYPELKSDALVQEQITIYTANNEKIKQLKEERINASVWRWWLYFGH